MGTWSSNAQFSFRRGDSQKVCGCLRTVEGREQVARMKEWDGNLWRYLERAVILVCDQGVPSPTLGEECML